MNYTKDKWVADIRIGLVTVHTEDKDRFNCLDGMRDSCIYWSMGYTVEKNGAFDHWVISPEAVANAHLIAAAPDLYEACKRVINARDYLEFNQAELVVEKALAKAEGK